MTGKRIKTELERPLERYKRKVLELGKSYRAGAISQETFVRGAKKLKGELNGVAQKESEAAAGAEKLRQQVQRIVRDNELPLERFKRKYKELNRIYRKGGLALDQKRRAAKKLRVELRKAGEAGKSALGSGFAGQIRGTLAGLASVSAAIGLIRREYDEIRDRSDKATQTQLTAAAARDVLKKNIAILPREEREAIIERVEELARKQSIPQRVVDKAFAESFSAQGGKTEAAFENTGLSIRFNKTDQEAIGPFAGSLGDISKATKSSDAVENLGFLLTVGALSRVADSKKQALTIPSALAGAAQFDTAPEVSGSLFGALSQTAADVEGRKTGTGVIRFTEQLKKFSDNLVDQGSLPKEVDTFLERVAELRKDPALAKSFSEAVSLEAKVKGPLQGFILDSESETAKLFRENIKTFDSKEEQKRRALELLGDLGQGRLATTASTGRIIQSGYEQYELGKDGNLSLEDEKKLIALAADANGSSITWTEFDAFLQFGSNFSRDEAIKFAGDNALLPLGEEQERASKTLLEIRDALVGQSNRRPITTRAQ